MIVTAMHPQRGVLASVALVSTLRSELLWATSVVGLRDTIWGGELREAAVGRF
jgi:hypothetical protein